MTDNTIRLDDPLYAYFRRVAYDEPPALAALRAATAPLGGDASMQISPEQGALMAMLVRLTGARRILELGTFTGYSTLAMALALPPDGRIVASDVNEEWTAIGRRHWQAAGVGHMIDLRIGKGLNTIAALMGAGGAGTFDLVFVDADKKNYEAYYEGGLDLLRPGGLMLVDNVLWHGDVARPAAEDRATRAIRALNDRIRHDDRVDFVMVPVGDGLTLARKRGTAA